MKSLLSAENRGIKLILLCIFLVMLVFNFMTPMFADDYIYVLNLNRETPLTDLRDVFNSVSSFRSMHNGRVAAHFFAQLFLLLPKAVFCVVNAAMCTLLFYCIHCYQKTAGGRRSTLLMLCAVAMVWLLMPGIGHSFLWLTGSCSYLWAITFMVCFLYPFFREFVAPQNVEAKGAAAVLKNLLALGFAFFAGSYSENGAFSALAVAFCFLALILIRDRKLPRQLSLRFAVACGGFLGLMLAPAELGTKNVESSGAAEGILERLGLSLPVLLVIFAAILLAAAVFLWGVLRHRKTFCLIMAGLAVLVIAAAFPLFAPDELAEANGIGEKFYLFLSETGLSIILIFGIWFVLLMLALAFGAEMKVILAALVFGIGALASIVVFAVAIYFPARGVCVASIYTAIASTMLLSALSDRIGEKALRICTAVLLALFVPAFVLGAADINNVYGQYKERMEVIAQAQAEGDESLLLKPLEAVGKYAAVWQGEAADYYFGMEAYYGIDSILIEGAEEF